jgi:hypothetical protein
MTGLEKARETSESLKKKSAVETNPPSEPIREKEIAHTLSTIQNNADLAKMYNDAAGMGSENLQGSYPLLKIHVQNKSPNNILINGKEPNNGWYYHTKTQEQFESPIVHILTVSKSFYAKPLVDKDTGEMGDSKLNQIIGGVLVDNRDAKPFMMYLTGLKLSPFWDFAKEISQYTHGKPVSIPMFALTVKLSSQKVDSKHGPQLVPVFEVVRTADGSPVVITSPKEFMFLKNMVTTMTDTINSLVTSKSIEEIAETVPSTGAVPANTDSAGMPIDDIIYDEDVK